MSYDEFSNALIVLKEIKHLLYDIGVPLPKSLITAYETFIHKYPEHYFLYPDDKQPK